ncbi:MAG: amino acid adenylation domain-containing protein [Steroidobacteraceae bacterium]
MRDESRVIAEEFAGLSTEGRRRFISQLQANDLSFAELPIVPASRRDRLPLSYAQARLWFLWRLDEASTAYHMSSALQLTGSLDEAALRCSFVELVNRHESLRAVLHSCEDGSVEQSIGTADHIDYVRIDLGAEPCATRDSEAAAQARRVAYAPFDLASGALFRVALIRLAADEHVLVVAMHHIVSDGWSMQIVVDEFVELYRARIEGRAHRLEPLRIQYGDYALWQRNWLEAGERDRQLAYWTATLGTEHPVLQLPTDHPRSATSKGHAGRHAFELASSLVEGLRRRAHQHRATLFTMLLAGFQALLYRYTGQRDIRVGMTNANRNRAETRGVVGLSVNTQVLRSEVSGAMTLASLLDQASRAVVGAQEHQDLPFDQLVDALQPQRDLSHPPLFQVMMNHQRLNASESAQLPGLTLQRFELGEQAVRFDLVLNVTERAGLPVTEFTYAAHLFDAETIERMGRQYVSVLQAVADDSGQLLCQIPLVDGGTQVSPMSADVDAFEPVHSMFARRAAQSGQAPALHCEGCTLSYEDLQRWSDRVALELLDLGVEADMRIGVCVERSVGMVAALLGILKSGAAFVPLDPAYPPDRLAYMMKDSQIRAVVTDNVSATQCAAVLAEYPTVRVDTWNGPADSRPLPAVPIDPQQLAYVIYTSGSTGLPKGVAISHRALSLHLDDFIACYGITDSDRTLQSSTINFDVALHELFPALVMGGQVQLRGPQPWDLQSLNRTLKEGEVTFARIPTAFWQQWLHALPRELPGLRQITVGGEALPGDALGRWMDGPLSDIPVDNLYGPTETTVACLAHTCRPSDARFHTVPIGKPYASRSAIVIDADGNEVPIGGLGELCISGETLARGYLGRPALTAERFVPDPAGRGGRLYRSGDLCRQRADGVIEYLGRLDQQVKLRGHRIELGEVEVALRRCEGVGEAVVELRGEGDRRRLIGYVVGSAQPADIRSKLQESLPDYMVPSAIVSLEQLPLHVNGKVDRKALPEPEYVGTEKYEAPRGEVEELLAAIWSDLLSLPRLGRHDNFFEVGGDSILSLQIVARTAKAGWKITPRQMFERQTVAQLAVVAEALDDSAVARESAETTSGVVPLLPIQAWFLEQPIPHRNHWNQSVLLSPREPLEHIYIAQALRAVMGWHDALRFRFTHSPEGLWQQSFTPHTVGEPVLWLRDAKGASEIGAISAEAQRSLDLNAGPLWRAVWMTVADGSQRLLLVIHHLVVDGVSWRVLLQELQQAYEQAKHGEPPVQPARSSSYQSWARRLPSYAIDHAQETSYWQQLLASATPSPPPDHPEGANRLQDQTSVAMKLGRAQTQAMLKDAPAAYRTQVNDLLLTALGRAFARWTGQAQVLVDVEGHGREDVFENIDLSRTVGWFTSVYPVLLDAQGTPGEALKRVKQMLREVPNKGLGYGVFKYLGTTEQRAALSGGVVPQVSFNYLGQLDGTFDETALWQPAAESAGESRDPSASQSHELAINGQVYEGALLLNIYYSGQRYRLDSVQALADLYREELERLIDHCTSGASGVTPSDFPLARLDQAQLDALPIPAAEIEDLYPMTPMQQGMVLHTMRNPGSGMYLMQSRYELNSAVDIEAFENAWARVVERHSALRTAFLWTPDGALLQLVKRQVRSPVEYVDWRGLSREEAAERIDCLLQEELTTGVDIADPPLLRIRLIRLGERQFQMLQSFQHILMDAWCRSLLLMDFFAYYSAHGAGVSVERPPLRPYRDFIAWLGKQDREAAERYWREMLAGFDAATPLPMKERGASVVEVSTMVDVCVELNEQSVLRLQEFAQRNHVTANTVVQGAWALLLSRYANQKDVLFGVTVAGRPTELPGIQETVGLFIQTIPLRISLDEPQDGLTVQTWLKGLLAQNAAMRHHEHLSLTDIQMLSEMPRGQDLFQSLFVFENAPTHVALKGHARELSAAAGGSRTHTNYPITVVVMPGSRMVLQLTYEKSLFDRAVIDRMAEHFRALVEQCVEHPELPLRELQMLSSAEQAQLALDGRGADDRRGLDKPFIHLFEAEVARGTQRRAVQSGSQRLTYGELSHRAKRLGRALQGQGVRRDDIVAVFAKRSPAMLCAALGIFTAGGAYLALDPKLPPQRLAAMLKLSGARCVLAMDECAEDLQAALSTLTDPPRTMLIEQVLSKAGDGENLGVDLHPENAAYVIFTSGSTGEPKGVVITSQGMLNNHWSKLRLLPLTSQDVVAQTASQSFDISVWQMLAPLLCGATVDIVPDDIASDPVALLRHVKDNGITVLQSVPALIQGMLAAEPVAIPDLRWMLPTGEALHVALARRWFERYPHVPLINAYGPAECADDVALHRFVSAAEEHGSSVAIGKAIDNTQFHVLDSDLTPVPAGIPGELYVSGVGVGRGYLGRLDLTAERFVADPFARATGSRLYRTGDIVRQRSDGLLEYVGRVDQQIKIHGFRIEIGEIEAQLARLAAIREGAVGVHDDALGGRRLVAYVVPQDLDLLDADAETLSAFRESLRARLLESLPEHMVPGVWVVIEKLPLTPNGKLDRKRLPQPDLNVLLKTYEAPRGEIERTLAGIWSEILGVERVGRQDDFFELGGHSLLALTLLARMRQRGFAAQVRSLFQQSRLATFARTIERTVEISAPANGIPTGCTALRPEMLTLVELDAQEIQRIETAVPGGAANIQDIYPLAPLQEGILFHHIFQPGGDTYITPHLLSFDTESRLRNFVDTFKQVLARHDIFRTAVLWEGLRAPVQVVYREATLPLAWLEDERGSVEDRLWHSALPGHCRIDVRQAPMIRAVAAHDPGQDRWLLLLVSHHLVNDHATLDFIVDEIALLQQGRQDELASPSPFRNFVAQARSGVSQADHDAFFKDQLGTVQEATVPFGLLDVLGDGRAVEEATLSLSAQLSAQLRALAKSRKVSAATIIHLAWAIVMGRTAGKDDVVFGTVLFGRMQSGEGAERGLGLFINTLPIRISLGAASVGQCLRDTHATLSELLHHEHASLALAQRCSGVPAGTPLFSALLNYRYSVKPEAPQGTRVWEGIELLRAEERTNYPITMSVDDRGEGFDLVAQAIPPVSALRLCEYLQTAIGELVSALEDRPAQPISELAIVGESERIRVQQWEAGTPRHEYVVPVHRLIERQVRQTPVATALVCGEETLSYRELNRKANRLAHRLISLGVGPEVRVGIAVERSIGMVVGLLAILKAGGAYVPLDPEYPLERLDYMLDDSGIGLLLTQSFLRDSVPVRAGLQVLELDTLDLTGESEHDPTVELHGDNLAYVIYTSGSTGKPKGAANRHRSLHNRLAWMQDAYDLSAADVVLQKTPFSFDVSVWEFFWPLMQGARLAIAEPGIHRDPRMLVDVIRRQRVSTLHFVPSMLNAFLEQEVEECTSLRRIVCSGEALSIESQTAVLTRLPWVRLYNLYGPTEAAIDVTHWECVEEDRDTVPIGRPIAGTRTVVLDAALNAAPAGVAGELYLGGVGLARGYLGRPILTSERFVADPFSSTGERLYRTGDLVRWSEDGVLEYLGRADHQVKIRGLRIEPGEIESQLLAQPEVREAVVVAQDGPSGPRLVAYLSGNTQFDIDATLLGERLSRVLPEYMVPSAFVVLERLPLNPNGKLDRKALPKPQYADRRLHEAPRGDVETALSEIWCEVLDVERVSRHDNFFELGGHSLALVRVQTLVHARMAVQLPLRSYFERTSLHDIAHAVLLQRDSAQRQDAQELGEMAALLERLES